MSQVLIITGRLGADPVMRFTPAGEAVTNFSVAVDESYTNAQGTKVKRVTWFRCTVWGKRAESANEWLKKGSGVFIQGKMSPDENGSPRTFKRQDGSIGASYEVRVIDWQFGIGGASGEAGAAPSVDEEPEIESDDDGPIPFIS